MKARISTFFLFRDEECGNESKQAPHAAKGEDCVDTANEATVIIAATEAQNCAKNA